LGRAAGPLRSPPCLSRTGYEGAKTGVLVPPLRYCYPVAGVEEGADWRLSRGCRMAMLLGFALGSVASAFLLFALAEWVLKKAPPVTHGIGPGIGCALFMWGGWDDPTAGSPIEAIGAFALGTALMYLLVSLLRKPRRTRLPELALSLSLNAATLLSFGPAWAKSTYVASGAFNCADKAETWISAALSARLDYCRCALTPVFATYRPSLSDIWTRGGLLAFERQASTAMEDAKAYAKMLERNDDCSTKHFEPHMAASLRKKGIENIATQTVSGLAGSAQLANVAPSVRDAYAACLVRVTLDSCKPETPAAAYRCVTEEGDLAKPAQDAIASDCVPLLARK